MRREGGGKVQKHHFIDPCGFEMRKLFRWTGKKTKIDTGRQDFYRVRVEGQYERRSLCVSCRLDHRLQQRTMTQMMAVEIPDRGDWIGTCTLAG